MSAIDTTASPSVRARLQELSLQQHRIAAPAPAPAGGKKPPPPPLPTRKTTAPPPLPTRRDAPPSLPTRKTAPPQLPQRGRDGRDAYPLPPPSPSSASIRSVSSTSSDLSSRSSLVAPTLPARRDASNERAVPVLPVRRSTSSSTSSSSGGDERAGGAVGVPVVPPLPVRKSAPSVLPLPAARKFTNSNPMMARKLPPPVSQAPPPPLRRHEAPVPVVVEQDRDHTPRPVVRAPPPVSRTSCPPPVPCSSRPVPTITSSVIAPPVTESVGSCWHCRDYSGPDSHARRPEFARQHVPSVDWLGRALSAPFSSSATDRARAIFTWLHLYIAYDTAAFFGGNIGPQSPATVFRSGLSVCQGYAELFEALATAGGVEAVVVTGHGKGFGYTPGQTLPWPPTGHAWNAFREDEGEWHLVDCCWGAGNVNSASSGYCQDFKPVWFVSSAEEFGERHFPIEERWQCLSSSSSSSSSKGPRTWEEYCTGNRDAGNIPRPKCFTTFYDSDHNFTDRPSLLSPNTMSLTPYIGSLTKFRISRAPCEHAIPLQKEEWVYFLNVGTEFKKENWVPMRLMEGRRHYEADVWLKGGEEEVKEVKLYMALTWKGESARGLTVREWQSGVGKVGWSWCGLVEWGVE